MQQTSVMELRHEVARYECTYHPGNTENMEIIKDFRLNSKLTKLHRRFVLASTSNGRLQNKQTGLFLPPTTK